MGCSELIAVLVLQMTLSSAAVDVFLSETVMTGSSAYFPVKRAVLQGHLQKINDVGNGLRYYLPTSSVMECLQEDEHVISIVLAHEDARSFSEIIGSDDEYTTVSNIFSVVVPYLSTTEGGSGEVSLLLYNFRSEMDGRAVIDANVVIPTQIEGVDVLVIRQSYLLFVSEDLTLELKERESARNCGSPETPTDIVDSGLFGRGLLTSRTRPDFTICEERPTLAVDLCDAYRESKTEIIAVGNQVCEYLRPVVEGLKTCTTVYDVVSASPQMRQMLFLADDVSESVTATLQKGLFGVYLRAPCYGEPTAKRYESVRRYFSL